MTTTHATIQRFRFSPRAERHARRLGIAIEHATDAIAHATSSDQDARGSHWFDAEIDGVGVRIVLAPADSFLIDRIERR